jgi:class 3 adenylate cyclase
VKSTDSSTDKSKSSKRQLKGYRPSIKSGIFFWFLIFVIPVLLGKFLIANYSKYLLDDYKLAAQNRLKEDLKDFSESVEIEYFLTEKLGELDREFSAFCAGKPRGSLSLPKLADFLGDRVKNKIGAECLYVFLMTEDQKRVFKQVGSSFAKEMGFLGHTAVKIFLQGLISGKKQSNSRGKLFKQVFSTILGIREKPEFSTGKLYSFFTTKLKGRRLFAWLSDYEPTYEEGKKITFFIAFTEDSVSLKKHFYNARFKNSASKIKRLYGLLPASLKRYYFEANDGTISLVKPVSIESLRYGSHTNRSPLNLNIGNRRLDKSPAKAFYLVSQTNISDYKKQLSGYESIADLFFLVVSFLGLYVLQILCFEGRIPFNINTKLFIAIFAAIVLPIAVFMAVSHRYFGFFQKLLYQNQRHSLEQELRLLEFNIQDNQNLQLNKLRQFKNSLKTRLYLNRAQMLDFFAQKLGQIYDGYVFIRNDGLVIDKLNEFLNLKAKDLQKLDFLCQLFKSQACRIFVELGVQTSNFNKKIKASSHGIKILAISDLFLPLDLMNFCLQDGEVFGSEGIETGDFRLITYNLFPDEASKPQAFAGFILDAGKRSQKYLFQQADRNNIFVERKNGILYRKAVFQLDGGNRMQNKEITNCWPAQAAKDKDFLRIFRRIIGGNSDSGWIETATDGTVKLFAGRKVAKLPLIITATAIIDNIALKSSLLGLMLLIFILYALFIIIILANSLTLVFLRPVKALLRATGLINQGNYPLIESGAVLEMGVLLQKFNYMTTGLLERQRLKRFVSEEATKNIEIESYDLKQRSGEKIEAAVMFIHVRDFADLCNQLSATKIISILNTYYSFVEPVIKTNEGAIDKYVGDAVMADFTSKGGAGSDSFYNACNAACKMISSLQQLKRKLANNGLPEVEIGIGIAGGKAIRGRVGAKKGRKDFTLIGNVVNLSARLEALTHNNDFSGIMVSQEIEKRTNSRFEFIDFGFISVKGKQKKQRVFLLKGLKK